MQTVKGMPNGQVRLGDEPLSEYRHVKQNGFYSVQFMTAVGWQQVGEVRTLDDVGPIVKKHQDGIVEYCLEADKRCSWCNEKFGEIQYGRIGESQTYCSKDCMHASGAVR